MVGVREIQKILRKFGIKLDPMLDQNIMIDDNFLKLIIESANLHEKDVVLEIGAGSGILTRRIAEKAGYVIAIEIDERFKEVLEEELSGFRNVKILIGNALKIKFPEFNKVIGNLPFSICDSILKKLSRYHFDLGVVTIPKSLAMKIKDENLVSKLTLLLNSTFEIHLLSEVPRDSFYPIPSTDAMIVKLLRRKYSEGNIFLYFVKEVLLQEDKKLKNALVEALIRSWDKILKKKLTKRGAKEIVRGAEINKDLLEEKIASIPSEKIFEVFGTFKPIFSESDSLPQLKNFIV